MAKTTYMLADEEQGDDGLRVAYYVLAESHAELIATLERCQSMPLLMKTWDKASRDAAYDEIQAVLTTARKL